MKSRQLGYVLIALIAVGLAGIAFRVIASGGDEVVLEGLVQVGPQASDRILVEGGEFSTEIRRLGSAEEFTWFVDNQPVFEPRMAQFWQATSDLYDAQLVSINPNNHPRMGVVDGEAIEVSYFQGGRSLQEKFIVGTWKQNVRLCYFRRSGQDETYGIPCPAGNIFDPNPDTWKNPVAASIPPNEISEIQFTYLDEQFALRQNEDGEWRALTPDGGDLAVNQFALGSVFSAIQLVVASGFANEEEADALNFAVPDAMVRVLTREDAQTPGTRLRFLRRDAQTMYLSIPSTQTVYIVDNRAVAGLLLRLAEVAEEPPAGGG